MSKAPVAPLRVWTVGHSTRTLEDEPDLGGRRAARRDSPHTAWTLFTP